MSLLTGIARITVDGELLESLPEAKLMLGGKGREGKTGHKFYGHTEKIVLASVECKIVHHVGTPVQKLRDSIDMVILFECDSGVTYKVGNAYLKDPPDLSDGSGEMTLNFEGEEAKDIT